MSRQLSLRVSDPFARKLGRVAGSTGKPMSAGLESIGTPALDAAEADARVEAEALAAWEVYQLTGASVAVAAVDGLFEDALARARSAVRRWDAEPIDQVATPRGTAQEREPRALRRRPP
jgi:hypothetical protein